MGSTLNDRYSIQAPEDTRKYRPRFCAKRPAVYHERQRIRCEAMTATKDEAMLWIGLVYTKAGESLTKLTCKTRRALGRIASQDAGEPIGGVHLLAERAQ